MPPPQPTQKPTPWLTRWSNNHHPWRQTTLPAATKKPKNAFTRPLGLVELSFDTDGTEYGGRADMNALLTLEISHTFASPQDLRRRIALAWTCLRLQHVMLMSRTVDGCGTEERRFAIESCEDGSMEDVVDEVAERILWIEDFYSGGDVDAEVLYRHCLNVGRIIDPRVCLSRLFVLPVVPLAEGRYALRFLIVVAHQISDGLSAYNWYAHFVRLLNQSAASLEAEIEKFRADEEVWRRLPPAQEDLYPKAAAGGAAETRGWSSTRARERWFWAVMRVLRHIRRPLPRSFINPLRRAERLAGNIKYPRTFDKIFDYSAEAQPPMNCGQISANLSPAASKRMISLCRAIRVSVGAGCFALAGMAMMELHEALHPDSPLPFTASFPLNPRAFFGSTAPADSCMLAFSEGIVMPFLPSSLPVEGRFKVIARHANRDLRMYQKRAKSAIARAEGKGGFDPHDPTRLLATGYLAQLERVEAKLPPHRKTGVDPQGSLLANIGPYGATCGVSSVGSTASYFRTGLHDLSDVGQDGKDFAADFRGFKQGVRARENEFLVGSSTDAEGIVAFAVSYDLSGISEEKAEEWSRKIERLLEVEERAKL